MQVGGLLFSLTLAVLSGTAQAQANMGGLDAQYKRFLLVDDNNQRFTVGTGVATGKHKVAAWWRRGVIPAQGREAFGVVMGAGTITADI